jgi:hypothetical protein
MNFKFLTNNENTLFNNRIINLCSDFFSMFIADYENNVASNRQLTIADLGTFYIIEFEHVLDMSSYFGTVIFVHQYFPSTKLTIYLRDNNIMSVTTSNT